MRKLISLMVLLSLMASPALAAHAGKTVGAIRWDPWYADAAGSSNVTASIEPSAFQGRAPSCASVVNAYILNMTTCNTQAVVDAEITAAHTAGLDYWAYVWYGATNGLMNAWNLHQTSSIKSLMKWCLLFSTTTLFNSSVTGSLSTTVAYLQQSNYQVVLTNRPLIYILPDGTSVPTLAANIVTLRAAVVAAGMGTPYIVILSANSAGAVAAAGADATGSYSLMGGQGELAGPFADLVTRSKANWASMLATGQKVVPTVTSGNDRRPRVARPTGSEAPGTLGQKPYIGFDQYYVAGTPSAIASYVSDMLAWLTTNAANSDAQTGLIYSWSEHDEGGSTLSPTLGGGAAILNAVAGAL